MADNLLGNLTPLWTSDGAAPQRSSRNEEERYRRFFELSSEGVWCVTFIVPIPVTLGSGEINARAVEHGRITDCNDAFARMYGFGSASDVIGIPMARLLVPSDPTNADFLRNFVEDGFRSIDAESHEIGVSGEDKYFVNNLVGEIEDGHLVRVWGTQRDVTERRQFENQLRHRESRFRALVEHSADGITLLAIDGRVLYSAPTATRGLGYAEGGAGNWSVFDFVHPDDHPMLRQALQTCVEQPPAPVTVRIRATQGAGEWRLFEASYTNLLDNPDVGAIVVNYRDITERIRLEEQVLQAQKLDSIGRLAGGVAHDFNNMLTAILGYAELAELAIQPGEQGHSELAEIRIAALRARDLTQQLLAVARKQVITPQVLDLNDVVRHCDSLLRRLLDESIEIDVDLDPRLGPVKADPAQLEQVILNLALNARDAMPLGGRLKIETRAESLAAPGKGEPGREGPHAVLRVRDSGEGIPPEIRAHLFEPFFSTKPAGKGIGLGLATVYGIVRQTEGRISVSSEPGSGSTFTIHLPCSAERLVREPSKHPKEPASAGQDGHGPPRTILVVEDDDAVRELTVASLEHAGYVVLVASGGAEAFEIAARARAPIDLLLTDIVMPGMNGREVADHLAAKIPRLRVLFMSGYPRDAIASHGVLTPDVQLLAKPFTPSSLLARVRRSLESQETPARR